jgi:predicted RNA-binding protein with PUA-like domain
MAYWLMKSEPGVFGVDELERQGVASWEGVRNYQARNFMRDGMRTGDQAFLYHSGCDDPAVVAVMEICREAYPDPTQFDRKSAYYDPASRPEQPRWLMVDVRYRRRLRRPIPLQELKALPALSGFALVKRGNRLSVMPVSAREWQLVLALEVRQ